MRFCRMSAIVLAISFAIESYGAVNVTASRDYVDQKMSQISNDVSMAAITHAELLTMRDAGHLKPGRQYRITDYVATSNGDMNSRSANHPFDIVVTADDERTLNEHAKAVLHDGELHDDIVDGTTRRRYFADCDLAAWDVWYCLDNDTNRFAWADNTNGKGVIFRLVDEFQNDAPYDFKGIQFRRWAVTDVTSTKLDSQSLDKLQISLVKSRNGYLYYAIMPSGITYYGINLVVNGSDSVWYYTFGGAEDLSCAGDIYGNKIAEYIQAYTRKLNNIVFLGSACNNNTFGRTCYNNTFGHSCNNNTFGSSCNNNTFGRTCYINTFGTGCNNNMFGSSCYYNKFGTGCDNNTFSSECRDNTFRSGCYNNTFNTICDNNTFSSDCSNNTFSTDCEKNTFGHACYNNTFGQRCKKNTFGSDCNNNTFSTDCSNNTFGMYCRSNTFDYQCNYNTFGSGCNNNTFGNNCWYNTFGNNCYNNTFGSGCNNNTFGSSCLRNKFGSGCLRNTFGSECYDNTFGSECNNNTFVSICYNNTFGSSCSRNIFGSSCYRNTFGQMCSYNKFGSDCFSNTFDSNCSYNTFGSGCYNNTFGYGCFSNTFGQRCSYNKFGTTSSVKSYCRYIRVCSGNCRLYINPTGTTSGSQYYQNVEIKEGVNNTTDYKTIDDPNVGQTFHTIYKPVNSQEISL